MSRLEILGNFYKHFFIFYSTLFYVIDNAVQRDFYLLGNQCGSCILFDDEYETEARIFMPLSFLKIFGDENR